jgi:hypothetical protein
LPGPGELLEGVWATRHCHQKGFSGASDLWTGAVLPREVGRGEPQSSDATPRTQPRVSGHQRQDPFQAVNGHRARTAQRPTDVLMMNGPVDECDHSAETSGQPPWATMADEELYQLLR